MSTWALVCLEWRRMRVRTLYWIMAALVIAAMAWEMMLMLGPFLARQPQLLATGADIGYTDVVVLPWLAVFIIPAILMAPLATMSALAGERRRGTLPLLLASGLSASRIVLGKYLAAWSWSMLVLLVVLAMPATLAFAGAPDWGKLAAAALGLALLLTMLTAIGIAASAYSAHPALAAAISLMVSIASLLVNRASLQHGVIDDVANWLALPTHLQPMGRGLVATDDIAWFVIVTALALALAMLRVGQEKDRD